MVCLGRGGRQNVERGIRAGIERGPTWQETRPQRRRDSSYGE